MFYVVSLFLLVTAALVAFRPKPLENALWLILHFFLTSCLYVYLGSHFVAVIQILVYAGAIIVLFTFVIMLLNLSPRELGGLEKSSWISFVMLISTIVVVLLCFRIATPELLQPLSEIDPSTGFGSVEAFSRVFLTRYVWGFEVAGVLLLLALVGVGLLAYRRPQSKTKATGS